MSKILLIGDLHLKNTKNELYSKQYSEWLHNMQIYVINKILEVIDDRGIKEVIDLGDILDKSVLDGNVIYYLSYLLSSLQDRDVKVRLIDGNHTKVSNSKDNHYLLYDKLKPYLETYGAEVIEYDIDTELDALFVSHKHISKLETYKRKHKYLFSHIRLSNGDLFSDEIDIKPILKKFDTVFLGDIHSSLDMYDSKVIYTNSALDVKFERGNSTTPRTVLVLDSAKGESERVTILDKQYRKKVLDFDSVEAFEAELDAILKDTTNYYRIVVTDFTSNLYKVKRKVYNNILLETVKKETKSSKAKELADEIVNSLKSETVLGGFKQYCLNQNTRSDLAPYIESKLAEYENSKGD